MTLLKVIYAQINGGSFMNECCGIDIFHRNVITISSYQFVTDHASNNAKRACFEYPLLYALCDPIYAVTIATVYRRTCPN